MPEKITASGWSASMRCCVVAAILTVPMPPTVAATLTRVPLLVSMVPRVTLTPASSVTVMSLNADAILATSSSMAPMMAIVLMRSFLSIASRFSLGFAYFRFAHFQRRLPTACASSRSNASVICQLKHLSVMD